MLALLFRLLLVGIGALGARMYARDFVREYIRELVRVRLRMALVTTAFQFILLAVTAAGVHQLRDPLGGRLFGSALVWVLIAYNATRFFTGTIPDIADARRHLSGPSGQVVRVLLGISILKALVEMELLVLAVCLILGVYARFGVSSTFHLLDPWRELAARQ